MVNWGSEDGYVLIRVLALVRHFNYYTDGFLFFVYNSCILFSKKTVKTENAFVVFKSYYAPTSPPPYSWETTSGQRSNLKKPHFSALNAFLHDDYVVILMRTVTRLSHRYFRFVKAKRTYIDKVAILQLSRPVNTFVCPSALIILSSRLYFSIHVCTQRPLVRLKI